MTNEEWHEHYKQALIDSGVEEGFAGEIIMEEVE